MLNYIAQFVATWLVATSVFAAVGQGGAISKPVNVSLPHLLGAGNRVHLGTVLALVAGVAVWYVLTRTTLGFRVDVVGSNRVAARYAGINVSRTYIWVFAASGALAGLAGAGEILGVQGFLSADIGSTFTLGAIAVALLGRLQPIGVVFASLLLGALQAGAIGMQSVTGVPVDIIQVLEALIIVLVAAPLFLREVFHIRAQGATAIEGGELSKGWAG
jgi:simple sugar transport system permease protein